MNNNKTNIVKKRRGATSPFLNYLCLSIVPVFLLLFFTGTALLAQEISPNEIKSKNDQLTEQLKQVLNQTDNKRTNEVLEILRKKDSIQRKYINQTEKDYQRALIENRDLQKEIREQEDIITNLLLNDTIRDIIRNDISSNQNVRLENYDDIENYLQKYRWANKSSLIRQNVQQQPQYSYTSQKQPDSNGNSLYIIGFFVFVIILIGLFSLIYPKRMKSWIKSESKGLNWQVADTLYKNKIPVQDALEIWKASKKENLGITEEDIGKNYTKAIDNKKLLQILRLFKKEGVTVTLKDLKPLFSYKIGANPLVDVFIKAKEKNIDVSLENIINLYQKDADVDKVIDMMIKAGEKNIEVNHNDILDLNMSKVDIEKFIELLIRAKEKKVTITTDQLKSLYIKKEEVERFIDIYLRYQNDLQEVDISYLIKLYLLDVDIEKNIHRFIEKRKAGYQISLKEVVEISLLSGETQKVLDAQLINRRHELGIPVKTLENLANNKVDVKGFTQAYKTVLEKKISISRKELERFAIAGINIKELIDVLIEVEESVKEDILHNERIAFFIEDIDKFVLPKKNIRLFICILKKARENELKLSNTDLDNFLAQLKEPKKIEQLVDLLSDIKVNNSNIINKINDLPFDKIDIIALLQALKDCQQYGATIDDFRKLFLYKIDIKTIGKSFASLKEMGEKITLQELEELHLDKIDILKLVEQYGKLKQYGFSFSKITELAVAGRKIDKFIEHYENLKPDEKEQINKSPLSVLKIEKALAVYEQNKAKFELETLLDDSKKTDDITEAVNAFNNAEKENLDISLDDIVAMQKSGIDVKQAIEKATQFEEIVISPVYGETVDGVKVAFKISATIRFDIKKYHCGFDTKVLENKIDEHCKAVVRNISKEQIAENNFNEIPVKVEENTRNDRIFREKNAYIVEKISILDFDILQNQQNNQEENEE